MTRITSLGNAGFRIMRNDVSIVLDPLVDTGGDRDTNLVLITHDHWDHFNADIVTAAARRGALIGAARNVIRKLKGRVPVAALVEMEPESPPPGGHSRGAPFHIAGVTVTAFRTFHSHGHNSYLVEMGGLRFFHDGDNEKTQLLDPAALGPLDAVMMCCWHGSGWAEFLHALDYRRWLLMHLDGEELDLHEQGRFLPPLCDRVPRDCIALRPGQDLDIE